MDVPAPPPLPPPLEAPPARPTLLTDLPTDVLSLILSRVVEKSEHISDAAHYAVVRLSIVCKAFADAVRPPSAVWRVMWVNTEVLAKQPSLRRALERAGPSIERLTLDIRKRKRRGGRRRGGEGGRWPTQSHPLHESSLYVLQTVAPFLRDLRIVIADWSSDDHSLVERSLQELDWIYLAIWAASRVCRIHICGCEVAGPPHLLARLVARNALVTCVERLADVEWYDTYVSPDLDYVCDRVIELHRILSGHDDGSRQALERQGWVMPGTPGMPDPPWVLDLVARRGGGTGSVEPLAEPVVLTRVEQLALPFERWGGAQLVAALDAQQLTHLSVWPEPFRTPAGVESAATRLADLVHHLPALNELCVCPGKVDDSDAPAAALDLRGLDALPHGLTSLTVADGSMTDVLLSPALKAGLSRLTVEHAFPSHPPRCLHNAGASFSRLIRLAYGVVDPATAGHQLATNLAAWGHAEFRVPTLVEMELWGKEFKIDGFVGPPDWARAVATETLPRLVLLRLRVLPPNGGTFPGTAGCQSLIMDRLPAAAAAAGRRLVVRIDGDVESQTETYKEVCSRLFYEWTPGGAGRPGVKLGYEAVRHRRSVNVW